MDAATTQPSPGRGASWWRRPSRRQGLAVVVAAFVVSRVAYAAAGVRFDVSALSGDPTRDQWQLLDVRLLSHDLVRSLWNLHSQPPLYNLAVGLLLHLPAGARQPLAAAGFLGLGLLLVVATHGLLVELRVPPTAAVVLTLLVVADPAAALYENWLSWSYPTAALTTAGAYGAVRLARTGRGRWAVLAAGAWAAVVLTDPTYQWPWLVVALGAAGYAARRHWRRLLAAAAAPLLVVGVWAVHDAVLFGTATTSSWVGMNVAHVTLARAAPGRIRALVARGTLDAVALVPAFSPVDRYGPVLGRPRATGVPVLDERTKADGVPNYDNLAYVAVSARYLHDDLAYVRADPGAYARAVGLALEVWAVPADQYPFLARNGAHLATYARVYDALAGWQARGTGDLAGYRAEGGRAPSPAQLSWSAVVVTVLAVAGGGLVLLRRRGPAGLGALWWTVGWVVAVSGLGELGENMRFRFELGSLPLVVAAAATAALLRGRRAPGAVP